MSIEVLAATAVAVLFLVGLTVALVAGARRRGRPPVPGGGGDALGPSTGGRADGASATDTLAPARSPAGADEAVDLLDVVEEPLDVLERPDPVQGRMARLRRRLARSNSALGQSLLGLLSGGTIDATTWEDVEDTLLLADVGAGPAAEIVAGLRQEVAARGATGADEIREVLRSQLLKAIGPDLDRTLHVDRHVAEGRPAVMLLVGVNGTGKTTTAGKLARVLVAQDKDVLLGAADTFRAAAAEQLTTWGERVGVATIRSEVEGADPASVAFDAVRAGIESEVDVVLIDTAGRLQNKVGLMDELGKVKRVVEKHGPVDEVLLVLDATTGQNGMNQARVFSEVVDVTGIVLTKLDGTAKGGIVVAVQRELGVPVKLVGLGEGPDDLAPFEPETFIDALLS